MKQKDKIIGFSKNTFWFKKGKWRFLTVHSSYNLVVLLNLSKILYIYEHLIEIMNIN